MKRNKSYQWQNLESVAGGQYRITDAASGLLLSNPDGSPRAVKIPGEWHADYSPLMPECLNREPKPDFDYFPAGIPVIEAVEIVPEWVQKCRDAEAQASAAVREMASKPPKIRRASAMRQVIERAQLAEAALEAKSNPPPLPPMPASTPIPAPPSIAEVITALQSIRFSACNLEAARAMAKIALDLLAK